MAYQEFIGSTFDGADPCVYGSDPDCNYLGYKCSEGLLCYGYSGEQILVNFHNNFSVIDAQDNFIVSVLILVAIAICCKLGFVFLMTIRAREESKLVNVDAYEESHKGKSLQLDHCELV